MCYNLYALLYYVYYLSHPLYVDYSISKKNYIKCFRSENFLSFVILKKKYPLIAYERGMCRA